MTKITTADLRKGMFIGFRGGLVRIVGYKHMTHGRGMAHIRVKLKNLKTGNVLETTYKSGEVLEELAVNNRQMQYLYQENRYFYFMDPVTFEQISVIQNIMEETVDFLKTGQTYQLQMYEDEVIGVNLPKKVKLTVVETDVAVKGNTVTAATKKAKLETGLVIQVPLFVKAQDVVAVNPETKEYTGREIEKTITYILKTNDINFWPKEDVEKYGYQIISFE